MANYTIGVNPKVLKWARQKSGYSIEDVAKSFNKNVEDILLWEDGDATPTYNQLERLAYTLYKRPVAVFFFPESPEEPDTEESFRTLPSFEIDALLPDTLHAIRQAQSMQIALYELTGENNPSERLLFKDIRFNETISASEAARDIRNYLGIELEKQFDWKSTYIALKEWRNLIENVGIFIFKRSFKQDDISGFCLVDDEFPIIYLNNSTSKSRQIFSIFHELAHILFGTSGVTKSNDNFIRSLSGEPKHIEVFCNQFSSEILVPSYDFKKRLDPEGSIENQVEDLSDLYSVSKEVILRKFFDMDLVGQEYYETKSEEWNQAFLESRSSTSRGGNYYATQSAYLGDKFLNLVFSKHYEGSISLQQLSSYLNVKAKNITKLERFYFSRGLSE